MSNLTTSICGEYATVSCW